MRLTLKTPYRDGRTHVVFEPEDFVARLAAADAEAPRAGTELLMSSQLWQEASTTGWNPNPCEVAAWLITRASD